MHVKICGVRSERDVLAISSAGPDAAGFLIGQRHVSEDFVGAERARQLAAELANGIVPVVVTHLTDPGAVATLLDKTGFSAVQLHGGSSPESVGQLRRLAGNELTIAVAVHARTDGRVSPRPGAYEGVADRVVFDTVLFEADRVGGTGVSHDWAVSAAAIRELTLPGVLAGGLNPDNVEVAVRVVRPWGVDVNSGVEDDAGGKDVVLCSRFVTLARRAGGT